MSDSIYFNSVAMDTVAPVKIIDVHVSPINLSPVSRPRPVVFGADFVRLQGGTRTVTISFALLTNNITTRQTQLRALTAWARSDTPKQLTLPWHENLYLECLCTALPDPSTREWWESPLTIQFTTFDNPYWTSTTEKSEACGTAFTVAGSAPPLMRITRTLSDAATDQSYSDGTDTMTFSTIPAGDMVIDLNRQTAAVGSSSIMQYYTYASTFIVPATGTHTITGTGSIAWRERWE